MLVSRAGPLVPSDWRYLDELRNPNTYMINDLIPSIIVYLQTKYGCITDQDLSEKEDEIKSMTYTF